MWLEESRALCGQKQDYHPLIVYTIDNVPEIAITMDELVKFYSNPARYFITKVLGIYLRDDVIEMDSDELLGITSNLDRYALNNALVTWRIEGNDIQQFTVLKKKEGSLPDGILGDVVVKKIDAEVNDFIKTVQRYSKGQKQVYELAYNPKNNITISGKPEIYDRLQVFYRYGSLSQKERLKAFLWHIFVCATVQSGLQRMSLQRIKHNQ